LNQHHDSSILAAATQRNTDGEQGILMRIAIFAAGFMTLAASAYAQGFYQPDLACESRATQACFADQEGKDNAARRGVGVPDYCARQAHDECAKAAVENNNNDDE
jgi:hypothetical protein